MIEDVRKDSACLERAGGPVKSYRRGSSLLFVCFATYTSSFRVPKRYDYRSRKNLCNAIHGYVFIRVIGFTRLEVLISNVGVLVDERSDKFQSAS